MSEERRRVMLPSGREAALRRATVRDLLQAHRAAQFSNEPLVLAMALVAQVDGRILVYEDLLELPAADGLMLQTEVMEEGGENFTTAPAQ